VSFIGPHCPGIDGQLTQMRIAGGGATRFPFGPKNCASILNRTISRNIRIH